VLASTTVVHEGIEGIQVLPNTFKCTTTTTTTDFESFHFVTAGDKGILRLWSKTSKGCIEIASTSPESESLHYKALLLNKSSKSIIFYLLYF
jgi:hypothetical protein